MKKKLTNFATFDIETDPFNYGDFPLPFCCDFFDGTTHHTFWGDTCVKDCYESCISKFKGIVFAHNGGKFDFHYLLSYILKDGLKIFVIKNRLVMLKQNEYELRDSYALIPTPLSGYEKTKIDYSTFTRDRRNFHKEEIISYLKDDTANLYRMVFEFSELYGLGLTIRNRAFDQLKKFGYKIPETDFNYDNKLRAYYYGGRCESFSNGVIKDNLICADINSAYPYAMLHKHAWSTSYSKSDKLPKTNIGQCFIKTLVDGRGCFPLRTKLGLLFPSEKTTYHITGWEYEMAIKCGSHVKEDFEILEVIIPYDVISFKKFIYHFYDLKLECEKKGDIAGRLFAKLFMNSCYGGFALDPSRYKKYCMTDLGELPEENNEKWEHSFDNDFAGISVFESPDPGDKYFNVLTAASITGFVRAQLLSAILSHNVHYCDTDSIIYSGDTHIKFGDQLGEWKLEGKGNELYLAGKKLYAFKLDNGKFKKASKGVDLTAEQIMSVSRGNKVIYNRDAPVYSFKSGLAFLSRKVSNTNTAIRKKPTALNTK